MMLLTGNQWLRRTENCFVVRRGGPGLLEPDRLVSASGSLTAQSCPLGSARSLALVCVL